MPRYRNDGSLPLNFSDSGGPWVDPGEVFVHEIPAGQRDSLLGAQIISAVADPSDDADTRPAPTPDWPSAGEDGSLL